MEVARLRWPVESDRRDVLRRRGQPRLLVVADDDQPPDDIDVLEDWVRLTADEDDVRAREITLALRAERRPPPPFFDDDGLLRFGRALVLLSPLETRVTAVLVDHLGQVVGRDAVVEAGWPEATPPANTVAVTMRRVRDRLRAVGLTVRVVRSHGWMLEAPAR